MDEHGCYDMFVFFFDRQSGWSGNRNTFVPGWGQPRGYQSLHIADGWEIGSLMASHPREADDGDKVAKMEDMECLTTGIRWDWYFMIDPKTSQVLKNKSEVVIVKRLKKRYIVFMASKKNCRFQQINYQHLSAPLPARLLGVLLCVPGNDACTWLTKWGCYRATTLADLLVVSAPKI